MLNMRPDLKRFLLKRLVEADGGGAVEDDVDALSQCVLILFAEV